MITQRHTQEPAARSCVACGARAIVPGERIATEDLVAAWRREDEANGAVDAIEPRARAILSTLPAEIRFECCSSCGLEIAVPATVWSSDAYPRDQSYPVRWEFQRAIEDLGSQPIDVLEIGCGEGHFLEMAAKKGHRAVGIDFSEAAIERARARGVRAYCGGFDELARHVGHQTGFDAVALFQVIEHLADPGQLFSALESWTRPGARLLISCPGPRRFTRLIPEHQAGASDFWDYPPHHVLRWTLPALRAVVARYGWQVANACEEPFSWVAAGSHIGIARAIHRGELADPLRRRLNIGIGWLRLLTTPGYRAGMSLYICALRASYSGRFSVTTPR